MNVGGEGRSINEGKASPHMFPLCHIHGNLRCSRQYLYFQWFFLSCDGVGVVVSSDVRDRHGRRAQTAPVLPPPSSHPTPHPLPHSSLSWPLGRSSAYSVDSKIHPQDTSVALPEHRPPIIFFDREGPPLLLPPKTEILQDRVSSSPFFC